MRRVHKNRILIHSRIRVKKRKILFYPPRMSVFKDEIGREGMCIRETECPLNPCFMCDNFHIRPLNQDRVEWFEELKYGKGEI